jgi:hypothetical protein
MFADSDGCDDSTAMDEEECLEQWQERTCSSVGSSSSLEAWTGSRFWALADVESSDEELAPAMEKSAIKVACEGLTETKGTACPISVVLEGACTGERLPSSQPKLLRRQTLGRKPWKGPLLPPRSNFQKSLGDVWVTDRRMDGGGPAFRLADWGVEKPAQSPVGSPTSEKKAPRRDPFSNFEPMVLVPVRLCGPAARAELGQMGLGRFFGDMRELGQVFQWGGDVSFPSHRDRRPSPIQSRTPPAAQCTSPPAPPASGLVPPA